MQYTLSKVCRRLCVSAYHSGKMVSVKLRAGTLACTPQSALQKNSLMTSSTSDPVEFLPCKIKVFLLDNTVDKSKEFLTKQNDIIQKQQKEIEELRAMMKKLGKK